MQTSFEVVNALGGTRGNACDVRDVHYGSADFTRSLVSDWFETDERGVLFHRRGDDA